MQQIQGQFLCVPQATILAVQADGDRVPRGAAFELHVNFFEESETSVATLTRWEECSGLIGKE